MADQSNVESALIGLLAGVVYPAGTSQPSVVNAEVQLFRGWPESQALNSSLEAGKSYVTVFGQGRGVRNTTRYPQAWRSFPPDAATITATVVGYTVTLGGTVQSGQNVAVEVDRVGYVYAVQSTDTLDTIASALASQIVDASSNGPVLTLPDPPTATVAALSGAVREMRRQEQMFVVTCWCPDPGTRDELASAVDAIMAATDWLTLTDGTLARVQFRDTASMDTAENANLYRRDLSYLVEYATTQTAVTSPMIYGVGTLGPGGVDFGVIFPPSTVATDGNGDVEVSPDGNLVGT